MLKIIKLAVFVAYHATLPLDNLSIFMLYLIPHLLTAIRQTYGTCCFFPVFSVFRQICLNDLVATVET